MKITIDFKPECSLQDKLTALAHTADLLRNSKTPCNIKSMSDKDFPSYRKVNGKFEPFMNKNSLDNGYSITIIE